MRSESGNFSEKENFRKSSFSVERKGKWKPGANNRVLGGGKSFKKAFQGYHFHTTSQVESDEIVKFDEMEFVLSKVVVEFVILMWAILRNKRQQAYNFRD